MNSLTLLSFIFPILAGAVLLIWRPSCRKTRNVYIMTTVLISSAFVLSTAICTGVFGSTATAFRICSMSDKLVFAFRPDGASLVFAAIIGVLWPITTLYAFSYMEHEGRENLFFGFFIATFGVVAGIAYSANFFTMYLCYEFMTLVTLPLVMHGMDAKAKSAGKKYVLYSMTGAALVFIALIFFINYGTSLDFSYGGVLDKAKISGHEEQLLIVFVLAFFGFGVKAAIFPFYRWLPAASVAPTPVTALLHAVAVVKSGAFAVMRLIYFGFGADFLFGTWAQNTVIFAAGLTIIFGSIMSLRTPHLKRRLAYSTISNLSYILLAFTIMTPAGLAGGLLHMIYHAVIKITLFFCAGAVLHCTELEYIYDMDGLSKHMPVTCAVFVLASLALMGVPPLGGFVAKWSIGTAATAIGGMGYFGAVALIVSAVLTTLYMMSAAIHFYFPFKDASLINERYHDADSKMKTALIILSVLIVLLSLMSKTLLTWIGGIV